MADDTVIPLATSAQMTEGPLANLVSGYSAESLSELMNEATRQCESECDRRLAPFTITESQRAGGADPDEYAGSGNLPLDLYGVLGRSYAYSIGANNLVRHIWLDQYAPKYADLWQYSNVSITVYRSYGGSQILDQDQFLPPEPDSGHVFLALGVFAPAGSFFQVAYSGGYQTIPADLVRACKYMAGSIAAKELDPLGEQNGAHADDLEERARTILATYTRE